jgi:hypothetical protein
MFADECGEFGIYFDGDMRLTKEQKELIDDLRKLQLGYNFRWPNKTIPYKIQENDFSESKTAMGNPNRFEGQIYAKMSCRGPK